MELKALSLSKELKALSLSKELKVLTLLKGASEIAVRWIDGLSNNLIKGLMIPREIKTLNFPSFKMELYGDLAFFPLKLETATEIWSSGIFKLHCVKPSLYPLKDPALVIWKES